MHLLLLISATSLAQTPVMVSRFEAAQPDHAAIARQFPGWVDAQLRRVEGLEVQSPASVSFIQGKAGADYIEACPAEQVLGCTFDLAEVAETRWAVTGVVRDEVVFDDEVVPGVEVELTVLDVDEQEEAWSLTLPYTRGGQAELVDWVVRAVSALVADEEPPYPELDEPLDEFIDDEPFDPEQDLSSLEQEMGEVGHPEGVEDLGEGRQEREPMTMEQLLAEYGEAEPWRDLDISAQQYLRWWNSGWGYRTWQDKRRGRKGQVTVRGLVGGGAGPRGGGYHAQYAMDDINWRTVLEYYAWQAATQGAGLSLGMNIGYGVTPTVDVELGIGSHWGPFQTYVAKEYLGNTPETVVDEDGLQGVFEASLGARITPMPFSKLRPTLGGGLVLWNGTKGDAHAELPPPPVELPIPDANTLIGAYGLAGAELAINDTVGVVLQLPVQMFFAGTQANVYDEGSDIIETKLQPPDSPSLGWAIQAGVQLHLGGG